MERSSSEKGASGANEEEILFAPAGNNTQTRFVYQLSAFIQSITEPDTSQDIFRAFQWQPIESLSHYLIPRNQKRVRPRLVHNGWILDLDHI